MTMITWKKEYSLNNQVLDEQHKKMVKMINDLHDIMEGTKDKTALDAVMKELSDYTFYHFSYEESYMEKIGYPELEKHKECHAELVHDVHEIFNKMYGEHKVSTDEIYKFLKNWLVDHIQEKDQKIRAFTESQNT